MKRLAFVYLLGFASTVLLGCGASSKEIRQKAVATSILTLNTARNEWLAWDKVHQQTLVKEAPTAEAATEIVTAYRRQQVVIIQSFATAYATLALAAVEDTPDALAKAGTAIGEVVRLIRAVTAPGGTP